MKVESLTVLLHLLWVVSSIRFSDLSSTRRNFARVTAGTVASSVIGLAPLLSQAAATKMSKSGYDLTPMTDEEVKAVTENFTDLQRRVLLNAGTEFSGTGKTVNGYSYKTNEDGVWRSAVSKVPLFSSKAKYESGTGWPSFYEPFDKDHLIERIDPGDANMPKSFQRVEVLDRKSGTHLGHVFPDGPQPTGLRYCMNAAALEFVPKNSERWKEVNADL